MTELKEIDTKVNQKIFTKNDDALKFCAKLKQKGKIPFKYVIVQWD